MDTSSLACRVLIVGARFGIPCKFAHSEHARKPNVRCQRDDFIVQVSQTANMPDKNPFPSNLRAARKAKGWTLEQAAAAADTSRGYLSDLERGVRPMPPGAKLEKIALALDTTVSALAGGDPADPHVRDRRTVPVVGYVGAGAAAHFYGTGDGELDRVEAPDYANENTVAAEIRGESMGPLLEHWLVFWDEIRTPVTPDLLGHICVVGLPDDRILVKQLKAASAPGLFHLISNNEAPMLDQEIMWAAKVKGMQPR